MSRKTSVVEYRFKPATGADCRFVPAARRRAFRDYGLDALEWLRVCQDCDGLADGVHLDMYLPSDSGWSRGIRVTWFALPSMAVGDGLLRIPYITGFGWGWSSLRDDIFSRMHRPEIEFLDRAWDEIVGGEYPGPAATLHCNPAHLVDQIAGRAASLYSQFHVAISAEVQSL